VECLPGVDASTVQLEALRGWFPRIVAAGLDTPVDLAVVGEQVGAVYPAEDGALVDRLLGAVGRAATHLDREAMSDPADDPRGAETELRRPVTPIAARGASRWAGGVRQLAGARAACSERRRRRVGVRSRRSGGAVSPAPSGIRNR
jgi:hypothetical protein